MSSSFSYPRTSTKYQLWQMSSAPSYIKPIQCTNIGRMSSASSHTNSQKKFQLCQDEMCFLISKNPDKVPTLAGCCLHPHIQKPRQSTKFGRMNTASSYPKTQEKLCILISKIPDKVPTLARGAMHRHIEKPRQSTKFGMMSFASSYPKPKAKYQLWHAELCILISKNPRQSTNFGRMISGIFISKDPDKVPTLAGSTLHPHIQKPRQIPTLAG